jgi:hypothetical protein
MRLANSGNSTATIWRLALIAGVGILLTLPIISYGWPNLGHDSINHARWLQEFSNQLRAGELYPRWLTDANGGLGSPTFYYYPPLGHYLSVPWLSLWAPGSPAAWRSLGLTGALILIASGVLMYCWLARWATGQGALWGALMYLVLPWHTAIDLYNRGALAEFCGFLWLPLVLLGADYVLERRRGASLLATSGYSLLVLTHLPTAELLSPVLLGYSFFLAPRERRIEATLRTTCTMLLGLGVSAIYLFPAVFQQSAASVHILGGAGFYDFRKWFLGADIHSMLDFKMRVLVVSISMLLAVVAAFYFAWPLHRDGPNRTRIFFWLAVSAACLFCMTPLSEFLWSNLRPLAAVSFPYRFNTILSLAVAALWAAAAPATSTSRSRSAMAVFCVFAVFWTAGTAWAASRAFLQWRPDPKGTEMLADSERLKREPFEYLPHWAVSAQRAGIEAPLTNLPGRGLRLECMDPETPANALVISWQPRHAVLSVDTGKPATLLVGQFYYPGWQARERTGQRTFRVTPSRPDGFLSVDVPAGRHMIDLTLEAQTPEQIGLTVSAASFLMTVLFSVISLWRRNEAHTP